MNYQTSVMLFDRKETSGNETYRETFATRADAEAAAQQWITGAFDGPTQITVEECEDGEEDGKILLELWNRKARG